MTEHNWWCHGIPHPEPPKHLQELYDKAILRLIELDLPEEIADERNDETSEEDHLNWILRSPRASISIYAEARGISLEGA